MRRPRTLHWATFLRVALFVGVLLAVLVACAAGHDPLTAPDVPDRAGFWLGLWHGLIVPVTVIVSLFTDRLSVYEVHNNGNWYDVGFVLGVSFVFGSVLGSRRQVTGRQRDRRRDRSDRGH